ncbi:MAG: putative zinc-binding metallopeptidase [Planctomycetota bacterium]
MPKPRSRPKARPRARRPRWVGLADEDLLEWRLCDLRLTLAGSAVAPRVRRLMQELRGKGITLRPDVWIATDWFSPDDVPGIAVPFFVAHPRLARLEAAQMGEVEGGTALGCMQLLRHEAGHAIDHAYLLHDRDDWRSTFGRYSQPYRWSYRPRPYSRSYVKHLDQWYAQSHPAEDFAETFAVWLTPRSGWRRRYAGWPALAKLEYVDWLMAELPSLRVRSKKRARAEEVGGLRLTLGEYYAQKRARYLRDRSKAFDRDLRRLFAKRDGPRDGRMAADRFLRSVGPRIRRAVARWTGEFQYTVDRVLRDVVGRARELELVLDDNPRDATLDAAILLMVQTRNYVHSGYHRLLR